MTPQQLGLPAKFTNFNHYQFDAIEHTVEAFGQGTRFLSHCIPVGGGKTAVGAAVGYWMQLADVIKRFAYITPGKALQDQIVKDFNSVKVTPTRIVDMRGRDNYKCSMDDHSHVQYSKSCKQMEKRCGYTKAVELPIRNKCPYRYAQFVSATSNQFSTNYAYWLSRGYEAIAGPDNPVQLLVCDEAHHIEDSLTSSLTAELFGSGKYQQDADIFKLDQKFLSDKTAKEIGQFADVAYRSISQRLEDGGYYSEDDSKYMVDSDLMDRLYKAKRALDGNFVVDRDKDGAFLLQPVWVGKYAESMWRGVPYVLLMSGTINNYTHKYLGIKKENVDHTDWPYVFDSSRSPIYWVETASMTDRDVRANPSNINVWLSRFDQIAWPRMEEGRSGVLHTVSFTRAELVLNRYSSKYGNRLIANIHGKSTEQALKEYKERAAKGEGVCMISPSITTGQDLADELCRFNIVGKIPFEASKTPLTIARREQDKMYSNVRASNTFHQMIGRGTRNKEDWCENFVIDNSIGWFTKQGLMQKWCYVRKVPRVPEMLRVAA